MSAVGRQPTALASLRARLSKGQSGYAGKEIANIMAAGEGAGDRHEDIIAVQIYKVVNRADVTPDDLFVAGLRFVEAAARSNFKRQLAPVLADWARERWAYSIEEQQFYLHNPLQTVPSIREALASSEAGLAFVGKLLVTIEPAVKPHLGKSFREFLLSL
jgi:hypothetical protein